MELYKILTTDSTISFNATPIASANGTAFIRKKSAISYIIVSRATAILLAKPCAFIAIACAIPVILATKLVHTDVESEAITEPTTVPRI